jgi:hypothetical protein
MLRLTSDALSPSSILLFRCVGVDWDVVMGAAEAGRLEHGHATDASSLSGNPAVPVRGGVWGPELLRGWSLGVNCMQHRLTFDVSSPSGVLLFRCRGLGWGLDVEGLSSLANQWGWPVLQLTSVGNAHEPPIVPGAPSHACVRREVFKSL